MRFFIFLILVLAGCASNPVVFPIPQENKKAPEAIIARPAEPIVKFDPVTLKVTYPKKVTTSEDFKYAIEQALKAWANVSGQLRECQLISPKKP